MILEDPFRETSSLNIAKWLLQDEARILYVPPPQSEKWLKTSIERIISTRQIIRQIALELFGLTSKNIDVKMLTQYVYGDPILVLKNIATSGPSDIVFGEYGSISSLLEPYRQVPEIVKEINKIIAENGELDLFLKEANIVLSITDNFKANEIKSRLKSLREMGISGDLIKSLSQISELSEDAVKEYRNKVIWLCEIADSINSNVESTNNLCFITAVRIIVNDSTIKSVSEISKNLQTQRILIEKEPLEVLFSMLRRLQENVRQ